MVHTARKRDAPPRRTAVTAVRRGAGEPRRAVSAANRRRCQPPGGPTTRTQEPPMTLPDGPLPDVLVAGRAARAAANVLLRLRAQGELTGRALGDAGDAAAQQAILASLDTDR